MKKQRFTWAVLLLLAVTVISSGLLLFLTSERVGAARSIDFPVAGPASYTNDYYAPRSDGIHAATDIFANKHRPLLSAVDGTVTFVGFPQPSWGYSVFIRDDEGYTYRY